MRHILPHQVIGAKYSKWIVILQQFELVFATTKPNKSLVFAKLCRTFTIFDPKERAHNALTDESIYLIDSIDPWYGDILVYLEVQ